MKRRKLSKNSNWKNKCVRTEQAKHGLLGYERLEPRQLLAAVVEGIDWVTTQDVEGQRVTLTFFDSINPTTLSAADVAVMAPVNH